MLKDKQIKVTSKQTLAGLNKAIIYNPDQQFNKLKTNNFINQSLHQYIQIQSFKLLKIILEYHSTIILLKIKYYLHYLTIHYRANGLKQQQKFLPSLIMKLKKKELSEIQTLEQSWERKKKANKKLTLESQAQTHNKINFQNLDDPLEIKRKHGNKLTFNQTHQKKQEIGSIKPLNRLDKKIPLKYLNYFNKRNQLSTQVPSEKEFPMIPFLKKTNELQIEGVSKSHTIKRQQKPVNKNTMLLNQMIQILKSGSNQSPTNSRFRNINNCRPKRVMTEGTYQNFNQFIQKDIRKRLLSSKNARPVIIENQITRVSNLGNSVIRRNLKSQQKQRKKMLTMEKKPSQNCLPKDKETPQLLTFYGNIKINVMNGSKSSNKKEQCKSFPRNMVNNQFTETRERRHLQSGDEYNQFI